MKFAVTILAAAFFAASATSYFRYQRAIQTSATGQQYVTVDETIWQHARPDLGDLRIYSGETETPYALMVERGGREDGHRSARVLQQASVGGKTQFVIDMAGMAEYDHIELNLAARNFVAHARVEGQDDLHGPQWALLAERTLFDLSKENLGRNSVLRLPLSTYKYLRVTIDSAVTPADVLGATSDFRQEQKAIWRDVGGPPTVSTAPEEPGRGPAPRTQRKGTVLTFTVPENVPVDRVIFTIDPAQANFRREVEIQDDLGQSIGWGEINRIHMVRAGQRIDSDEYEVNFSTVGRKTIKVIIYNGDDPPLQQSARMQQRERRIYFDAPASTQLKLFYGDDKLEPPIYDYAKLFQQSRDASAAQAGAEEMNAAFTARPDPRPWTEQHPAALWIVIVGAVLVLGAVALRSMKTTAAS